MGGSMDGCKSHFLTAIKMKIMKTTTHLKNDKIRKGKKVKQN
jgi:hypothetical protein